MSAKISALGSLTGAGVAQTADLLPIVDVSVTQTKSILISELSLAQNKNGTEQATTSGTSITLSDIPSWATRVSVNLAGVSTNGTSGLVLTFLPSAIIFQTPHKGSVTSNAGVVTAYSAESILLTADSAAASVWDGVVEITQELYGSVWGIRSFLATSNAATAVYRGCGRTPDSSFYGKQNVLKLTTLNGTDIFDAGAVNVLYS